MLQQYTCIYTAIPDERTIILRQNFVDEGHFNLGNARRLGVLYINRCLDTLQGFTEGIRLVLGL